MAQKYLINASIILFVTFLIMPIASAELEVAPWYPKGDEYVFVCDSDLNATKYDWVFGDREKLLNVANRNVFHEYEEEGKYRVECVAKEGNRTEKHSLEIEIEDDEDACIESVRDAHATCEGGNIVKDALVGGCRQIICSSGNSSMQVLACDKPDFREAEYFEMYRQKVSGENKIKVCLNEDTCLSSKGLAGYSKSEDFEQCNIEEGEERISVEGFELGEGTFSLTCNATGFEVEKYEWEINNEPLSESIPSEREITFSFGGAGNHSVMCTASGGEISRSANKTFEVFPFFPF